MGATPARVLAMVLGLAIRYAMTWPPTRTGQDESAGRFLGTLEATLVRPWRPVHTYLGTSDFWTK
eukprot:12215721-Karenia_brevis.AAC.1